MDNSKLTMKKMNRYSEIISGVHLLQRLVKNDGVLILDRLDMNFLVDNGLTK